MRISTLLNRSSHDREAESSIAFKLRSMLEEESVQVAAPGASFATAGSAEWLVDGLDIEGVQ